MSVPVLILPRFLKCRCRALNFPIKTCCGFFKLLLLFDPDLFACLLIYSRIDHFPGSHEKKGSAS